jgi:ABC-type multidrug transport system fused ATPase/permease subunit
MTSRRRIIASILVAVSATLALSGIADSAADDYADEAFKRALVTFAVARGLNGVISVAQGTEVAVEPGGVGVNFTVGQILDPVNDLVEQFSSVMLVATSSLGLQKILLNMAGWWGTTAIFVVATVFLVGALWWPGGARAATGSWAARIFVVAAFLRFALPVLVVGTHIVFSAFLESEHDAAAAVLEATSSQIEEFNRQEAVQLPGEESSSFVDRLGELLDSSMRQLDVSGRIERLRANASNASEQIINLIVIFVLQTIILPLAFLWILVEGMKRAAGRALGADRQ